MSDISLAACSGGRSSVMMVAKLLEQGNEPDYIMFSNTGMESPATYEFLRCCNEVLFDNRLLVLEYFNDGSGRSFKLLDGMAGMKRDGEPFKNYVHDAIMLPSRRRRACTTELKVMVKFKYLYSLGYDYKETDITSYIGFRADEPSRVARMRANNEAYDARQQAGKPPLKWTDRKAAPLAEAGLSRNDVIAYWKRKPLGDAVTHHLKDMGIDPANPDLLLSNCAGCFFSNDAELFRVAREHPDIVDNWIEMEDMSEQRRREKDKMTRVPAPNERHSWVMKNLNRPLRERETKEMSFLGRATWRQIREAATQRAVGMFNEVPIAGGVW